MKKKILMASALALTSMALASCGSNKSNETVKFYLPDGTPALAVANLLDEGFTYDDMTIDFEIVSADQIMSFIAKDECDLAICPTIAAAQAYSAGTDVKLVTNNVFGNLYVVSTSDVTGLSNLTGKVVYTTSGATTSKLLEYELLKNNIPYVTGSEPQDGKVTICIKSTAAEIISLLLSGAKQGNEAFGVLGEPAVTKAVQTISAQGYNINVSIDMQAEYTNINPSYTNYPQASIISHNGFADDNTEFIESLFEKLTKNEAYLLKNYSSLNTLFSDYGSSLAGTTFTSETIARCNIGIEKAFKFKEFNNAYLKNIINVTADDDFFYGF